MEPKFGTCMPSAQDKEEIENDFIMWGREELFEHRN
jgi:hypothetical protein